MSLDVQVIDRLADADALAPEWRRLLANAAIRSPTRTPLWLLSWWRVFGGAGDRRLRLVTIRDGGELVGLAPLLRRHAWHRRAVPIRRIELLATGEDEADEICSDYVGILAARDREEGVAEAVAGALAEGRLGGWDELRMPAMREDDPVVPALERALVRRGAHVARAPFGQCPFIALPRTWEGYLEAIGGQSRYLVVRSLRELAKWAGPAGYTLTRAETGADLAEGRRVLHALHAERWSARGRAGVFASDRFARFHDLVMPKLLATDPLRDDGALELTWLSVSGRPIAVAYNVAYDGCVTFYQSGRALDVPKAVRPGIALHALAIQRAIREGRREYDFLAGEAQYKTQLALATRPLVELRAVAPSLRGRAVDRSRGAIDAIVKAIGKRTAPPLQRARTLLFRTPGG